MSSTCCKKLGNTIYVLHEYGAKTHYQGLSEYCNQNGKELKFREFSIVKLLLKSIFRLDLSLLKKTAVNFLFLFKLIFKRDLTIVLGIAPFDYRMIFFERISRNHDIYYHTSWPFWDQVRYPKKIGLNLLKDTVLASWKSFLETRISGVFSVTETAKTNLMNNYEVKVPVRVVYHSIDSEVFFPSSRSHSGRYKFLFVGRLEDYKGVSVLLDIFSKGNLAQFELGIAGSGSLERVVKDRSFKYPNIVYYGLVTGRKLADLYRSHDVFISPAKRGNNLVFEELFGITIIEALKCGLVPISTNHIGPSEIITNGVNGFIVDELKMPESLVDAITAVSKLTFNDFNKLKMYAAKSGEFYSKTSIGNLWYFN